MMTKEKGKRVFEENVIMNYELKLLLACVKPLMSCQTLQTRKQII